MRLDVADARAAYEAIRLAQPGGLGTAREQDVSGEPTVTLREAMALAADRDLVARQYVNDFEQVFEGVEMLREYVSGDDPDLKSAVTRVYLQLLAKYPDSLIQRKFNRSFAEEVSRKADDIVRSAEGYSQTALKRFDDWLRTNGPFPVNPGTTADLVAASLFVALRRGIIQLPVTRSASRHG
jgi:triphosphoribosyl-dephospho-CoA synthase